ncbi:cutinase family protein [Nocardia brasiliensis]|uniref:cutinase family protein n=1 Tax=Nocardia brasiliensis TaxID=37326 RepID=UPI00245653A6|nr:cutinase family protein [Nocardia brasiliensis]
MLIAGTVSAIGIAGLATGSAAGTPSPGAEFAASDCPAVAGVFLPGTWETNARADETRPAGLLGPVATQLAEQFGDKFTFKFPAYAAAAFDGMAYGNSKATGLAAARRIVEDFGQRCDATKFVLAGYSQGADAMGDLAASIGCSGDPISADRVLAVGLIADPRQGTSGGSLVGPQVEGEGIAGPRPSGFCALSAITAEICAQQDKYCATNASANPILAGLGRFLSQPIGALAGSPSQPSVESLISDVGQIDLPRTRLAIEKVIAAATQEHSDPSALPEAVDDALTALGPLAEIATQAKANPSAVSASTQDASSGPGRLAGDIIEGLSRSDLPTALESVSALGGHGDGSVHGMLDREEASAAADRLASSTAPFTEAMSSSSPEALAQASRALGMVKPAVVVEQVSNVATHGLTFAKNLPAVIDTVSRVIAAVTENSEISTKVTTLHTLFGELNALFKPLMVMAEGVDLRTVSQLVAMIPDTTGTAQTASVLLGLLDDLNIVALARQVGRLQEDLWGIAEAVTKGGDVVEIGTRMVGLVPTMLGFATIAVDALSGKEAQSHGASGEVTVAGDDISGLARTLVDGVGGQGGDALAQLTADGLTAANFFTSGVHQDYQHYLVDGERNAVDWLTDWFAARIRNVTGVV